MKAPMFHAPEAVKAQAILLYSDLQFMAQPPYMYQADLAEKSDPGSVMNLYLLQKGDEGNTCMVEEKNPNENFLVIREMRGKNLYYNPHKITFCSIKFHQNSH